MRRALGSWRGPLLLACLLGCSATADRNGDAPRDALENDDARQCVKEHPSSQREMDEFLDVSNAIVNCESDDGDCQASSECSGSAAGRECDPERIVGLSAAGCIALASGLENGIAELQASLTYDFGTRRIVWNVQNTSSRGLDGSQRGSGVTIDAITGEVLGEFGWSAIP